MRTLVALSAILIANAAASQEVLLTTAEEHLESFGVVRVIGLSPAEGENSHTPAATRAITRFPISPIDIRISLLWLLAR